MLRYFFLSFIVVVVCVVTLAGFRGRKSALPPVQIFPDMKQQPRFDPQHESSFFADGRAERQHPAGTVPMGYNIPNGYYQLAANNISASAGFTAAPDYYNTGKMGDVYGDGL